MKTFNLSSVKAGYFCKAGEQRETLLDREAQ
jgi:hypothetical protein